LVKTHCASPGIVKKFRKKHTGCFIFKKANAKGKELLLSPHWQQWSLGVSAGVRGV
jgi:hypothetical protein